MMLAQLVAVATLSGLTGGGFSIVWNHGVAAYRGMDGESVWSFGLDCVNIGKEGQQDPQNPAYRALDHFSTKEGWAKATHNQLKLWGFNTLGGWSDDAVWSQYQKENPMYFTPVLHLGSYNKAPWHDLWGEETRKAVDDAAKELIPKYRNIPGLLGYFSDNELGWWTDTLFLHYLNNLDPKEIGHVAQLDLVQKHYNEDFVAFKKDWISSATSWVEWRKKPTMFLRPGGKGIAVVNKWVYSAGRQYYSLMKEAIRRYDTAHLILGDRYAQFYDREIAASSKDYLDVASTNMGCNWVDGSLNHHFLETLYELTEKPIQITEFYMCARENRSGNKNSSPAFPLVDTQKQRAEAFFTNVVELASKPYVIGAHWFQYYDEPMRGRGDGEDHNMGFVDIYGKPYAEMVAASRRLKIQTLRATPARLEGKSVASYLVHDPMGQANKREPTPTLLEWPRTECCIPSKSNTPFADLYACYDNESLYFALSAMNYMDEGLYEGGVIPEGERCKWEFSINDAKPVVILWGGKNRPPSVNDRATHVVQRAGLETLLIAKIPLPKGAIRSKGEFRLKSSATTHSGGESMNWNSVVKLARLKTPR
ncbi:MAG: hypothetical protein JST40_01650 [Armatimonadetes bacterium]|nr:hypothetical protein [Armatimonadota bacterium]